MASLRRLSLTHWVLIGTLLGAIVGYLDHDVWTSTDLTGVLSPLSNIFLRMIKSIVAPLIFSTLVVGIADHGNDAERVGRLFGRSILYFLAVTTVALAIGLGSAALVRPGDGVSLQQS